MRARGARPRMRGAAPPGSNGARERALRESEAAAPPGSFPPVEEVEELSQELLRELSSGCTEELLRRGLQRRERLQRRLRDTQGRARQLAQAPILPPFCFGCPFCLDPPTALRRALQELQQQLQQLEQEQQEEEEHSLLPDVYVAQLYYEISRIDWDCSAEPGRIRGVHYGPDIAVPLDMDGAQHSGTFVSDFLWGLVPTQWRPRRRPVLPSDPPAQ
ncbi:kinetochore protein Spc24 [Passer montanus]|uniref:kinetochore protein Spc24 n=1 Tax=Passer montanus TaxID=9160 RepID=UPI0019603800|nr:kinetochore protein Spc24 [Passer montanus]